LKLRLLVVGKPRQRELEQLHERYAERIRRMGVAYSCGSVRETREGGRFSDDHVREREARALLERFDGKGTLIALHPAGSLLDTEQLAGRLEHWATPCATLLLGGPLGLHDTVLRRADVRWSLSPLTFPHELVRVLLAEQLYRALTLLRGLPYHK